MFGASSRKLFISRSGTFESGISGVPSVEPSGDRMFSSLRLDFDFLERIVGTDCVASGVFSSFRLFVHASLVGKIAALRSVKPVALRRLPVLSSRLVELFRVLDAFA